MASALPSAMANLGETIRTAVVKGLPPVFSLPPRAREGASLSGYFPEAATEGDARFLSDQTSLIKEEASLRRQISSSLQQDHMDYLRTTTFEHALGTLYVALRYEKLRREVHRFALEQLDLIFTFGMILHGDLLRAYREEGRQLAYQVAERHRQQVRLLIRQERDDRVGIEALCRVEGDDLWSIEAAQRGCFLEEGAVRQEWKAIEEDMRREILERFVRETQLLSKAKEKRCGRGPWEPRIQTLHPAEKRGSDARLHLGSSFGSADLSEGVVHCQPNSGEPWHLRGCVAPLSPSPQENAAGRESFPDWLEPAHAVHADSASSLSATVETTPPYASLTALTGAGGGLFSALHTFKTKLRETVAPTPLTRQPIATSGDATPRRRPFTRNEEANPSRGRVGDAPKALQPVLPSLLAKDNGEGWGWSEDDEPAGGGWKEAPCDARHVQKIPPSSLRSQIGKRDDPPRSQPRQQGGMPSMVALRREAPEARIVPLMKPSKESHQKDAGVGEPSGCLPLQASKRKTKRAPLAVVLPAELVCPLTEVSTSEALEGVKNEVEKESKGSLPVQPGAPLLSCSRTSTGLVEGSERDLVKDEGDPPNDGNSPSFPSLSIWTIPTDAAVVVEAPPRAPSSVTQEGRDGVVVRKPTRKAAEGGKGGGGRERRARGLGLVVMALPSTDAPPSEQQEAPS
ncbi:unnamed protein product [Phytomonas sp. EM1]|nr:unnamed protein product [Phytomonas sp. EM1]|eukprot:CCW65298.1 unnamed protein product [Phytomonas sp. isolate EM1]